LARKLTKTIEMKILQIINSLDTGGAEKLLLDTIPLYRKEGIEVDILVLWNNNHQFINVLKELNCCNIYILNESNNSRDIYKPWNIIKIKKILKEYDLGHVHLFPVQYFVPLANLLNFNKTKLIFTEHNTTNKRIENKFFRIIDKFFYRTYKKQICISDQIRDIFRKAYHFPKSYYPIIYNGVDLNKIDLAVPYQKSDISPIFNEEDKIIVQISAFRPQKDQDTLIKALQLLPSNFKLLLIGDGIRREFCKQLVKDLNLADRVCFLGQRIDVPEIMKTVDYIVLSSKYEGLSLSSIEGLGSGKPFLASDVPGLAEVVKDAGVLFEFENYTQLSEEILKLDSDSDYKNMVLKKSRIRANQYGINNMIIKHIDLYKEVYAS